MTNRDHQGRFAHLTGKPKPDPLRAAVERQRGKRDFSSKDLDTTETQTPAPTGDMGGGVRTERIETPTTMENVLRAAAGAAPYTGGES